ncbi:restriction endonuclease [Candidatus Margulisiibacteriota bacterium]
MTNKKKDIHNCNQKKGADFENLVEIIQKCIHLHSNNYSIKQNAKLIDIRTKTKRQHDILVTYNTPNKNIKLSIECKNWKAKVSTPSIEAFKTKCEDCKVDVGLFISASGFSKNAIVKASQYGIHCITIQEAKKLNRIDFYPKFVMIKKRLKHVSWNFITDELKLNISEYNFVDDNGDLFDLNNKTLASNLQNSGYYKELPVKETNGEQKFVLNINLKNLNIKHKNSGNLIRLTKANITMFIEVKVESKAMVFLEYKNETTQETRRIAINEIRSKNINGNIVIDLPGNEEGNIVFIPTNTNKNSKN